MTNASYTDASYTDAPYLGDSARSPSKLSSDPAQRRGRRRTGQHVPDPDSRLDRVDYLLIVGWLG